MINVAIVEDEEQAAQQLASYLRALQNTNDVRFEITHYADPDQFFFAFQSQFDLIFMDIQMPNMDGMTAAGKLREIDQMAALVFVTNLSRYAVNGYEVGALDYILKPVEFDAFRMKMRKVLRYCQQLQREHRAQVIISTDKGEVRMPVSDLVYVEISGHDLIYHTITGEYRAYGTMKEIEKQLSPHGLFRCNSCYLVNLRYVRRVEGFNVTVDQTELAISHPRKKDFMSALLSFNRNGGMNG